MKQINLSGLILEELIRVRLNEKDRDLSQWDVEPETDEDGWDVTPAPFDAKGVAKKLESFKGSFFGGQDLEDAYATYIVKNISSAAEWDKVNKELRNLSGKGIISYGRSFINDDEVSVWNPILKHVKKIYPKRVAEFVGYLGTDTYKKFLPNASNPASIAQEIYDSKSWTGDDEAQLIAAIKKISNAAAWNATNTQLQILTGEKGIISYIGSFVGHNDTPTWNPILLHMKKAKLVPGKVLNYIVINLGGPTLYPGIMDETAAKAAVKDEFIKIKTDEEKNNNTFGGETAISWGLAILGYLGYVFGLGAIGMLLKRIGQSAYRAILKAAGKEVVVYADRPYMIKRGFYKLEQFISNGILGNTGSLRRFIRQMQHENLMTATQAREAMTLIKTNRYAIAAEIRKTYMREVIANFARRGNKSKKTIDAIVNGIPTSGPTGLVLQEKYRKILEKIAEKELKAKGKIPKPPKPQVKPQVVYTTTSNP